MAIQQFRRQSFGHGQTRPSVQRMLRPWHPSTGSPRTASIGRVTQGQLWLALVSQLVIAVHVHVSPRVAPQHQAADDEAEDKKAAASWPN